MGIRKGFFEHIRVCIFRGLLAIIPILLCVLAVQLLYVLIDKRIMGFLDKFISLRQIPGLGILLLLLTLYLIGLIVSNIIGRQFFKLLENITERIPFIKAIYSVGKQLSQGLSAAEGKSQAFKKALLVKVTDNIWVPAFLMNSKVDPKTGEELYFVLIPTAPTPGSGFVAMVKPSQTIDPGWSIEECLKAIVSVGIVVPEKLGDYEGPIAKETGNDI
ncbi:MAG: DUF502 domain-containing protein [Candidatus Omnitrophica bacterium]|nr:DUF502 domain-containing protein [Candidatus Omnitrophota bacterium]